MSASVVLRKFGRYVVLGGVVLILSGVVFWVVTHAFTLTTVEVIGDGFVMNIDDQKLSKNLLFLSTDKLQASLSEEYWLLSSIKVSKHYPHTLVISAKTRKPIASMATPFGLLLLDLDGVVVDKESSVSLPLLEIPVATVAVGSKITDPATVAALGFLAQVDGALPIERITINDSMSLVARTQTTDILFTHNANTVAIADTLQTLFDGFKIKGTLPTRVDLRFDKPVVTF